MEIKNKICLLPQRLVGKISAGEVIERPYSVVKELIENSIDAGSSEITLKVARTWEDSVEIIDNGCGIESSDVKLAFLRHATSKIQNEEDLDRINTLGFRGEALFSIASVSRITIKTKRDNDEIGYTAKLDALRIVEEGYTGIPKGTSIEVRDLFYNTPARKKFLKNVETERKKLFETAKLILLPFYDIMLKIEEGSKNHIIYPWAIKKRERIERFLGDIARNKLIEIGDEQSILYGLISTPSCDRANSSHIYTYINGRLIKNQMLTYSVIDSYRNLLMRGRYPVAFVFLNIDPSEIDVNVHPTKREVRFKNPEKFYKIVRDEISIALKRDVFTRNDFGGFRFSDSSNVHTSLGSVLSDTDNDKIKNVDVSKQQDIKVESGFFSTMDILGVVCDGFVIARCDRSMYIIDQHAAEERIIFERLRDSDKSNLKSQMLLVPYEFEIDDFEQLKILEPTIKSIGFDLSTNGTKLVVNSVPTVLSKINISNFFQNLLGDEAIRATKDQEVVFQSISRAACKLAVKLGDNLTLLEIKKLLSDLDMCEHPEKCPHGRPTYAILNRDDLSKIFKR